MWFDSALVRRSSPMNLIGDQILASVMLVVISAIALSINGCRMIFPYAFLWMVSTKTTPPSRALKLANLSLTNFCTSCSSMPKPPSRMTTYALGSSPSNSLVGNRTPITAASSMDSCNKRVCSSSVGDTCHPRTLMSSYTRSVTMVPSI